MSKAYIKNIPNWEKEYLDMARESFEELSPLLNKEVDTIEEIVE